MLAHFDEGADRGGGGVENRHAVFFDHVPEAAGIGRSGRTLIHQGGGSVGQGAVDDVAVARNPAHIGGTPIDIGVFDVERPFERHVGVEVVARCGVDNSLGFAGAAGGVEHKQQVFAVHRLGGAIGAGVLLQVVPPMVAARLHVNVLSGALHDQHVFDAGGGVVFEGAIDLHFQGHGGIFAEAPIGGDHQFGLGIVQAIAQGFGAEPTKHDAVGRANAGTGQHGDRRFRDHRHVNPNDVAFLRAEGFQDVGKLANFPMQLGIGEGARVAGFAFPN